MKVFKKIRVLSLLAFLAVFTLSPVASAATSPSLGAAASFVLLADTYTNTAPGTTLTGDVGYTTGPAVAPTINGTTHVADSTYAQAGIDQNAALSDLNSQPCTFTFAPGAIDLATDTTHGPIGVYTPGVYCITGAASVGGGGTITLDGAGTYIFRMDGALNTSANSIVQLANGATACDVWWTPTAATTLGADSSFVGTDIDASGITIGNNVTWEGKALAFGGTVSTDADTISTTTCTATTDDTDTDTGTDTGTDADSDTDGTTGTPGLPNTGLGSTSQPSVFLWSIPAIIVLGSILYFVRKKA